MNISPPPVAPIPGAGSPPGPAPAPTPLPRRPVGRPAHPPPDGPLAAQGLVRVQRAVFPELNRWLNLLPDPRRQVMCRYSGAHIWWHVIGTYLSRSGSRNAFDLLRHAGQAPWNLGALCGQGPDDPRFAGQPSVTCSDNAARHAGRVDPEAVAQIPRRMIRKLLARRRFDGARLFGQWYTVILDGTVQEKCRRGFGAEGKSGSGPARYRYVLQASLLGPDGKLYPFMHEAVDMRDKDADKEDCELKAFRRLARRLKQEFPRLSICLVADALYCCQPVVDLCADYHWKYVVTFKEGRQPTTWSELLQLLPLNRANRARCLLGQDGRQGQQDFRWVEDIMLGARQTNVILLGETSPQAASFYAYATNFSGLTPQRVEAIANRAGRNRHLIEDIFNTQKNHGIGLEHVFCANATGSKNYYTMMQVAHILWLLTCHGCLRRLYDWARRATAQGLARALWEGLRACRLPPDLPPLGQLRFGFG